MQIQSFEAESQRVTAPRILTGPSYGCVDGDTLARRTLRGWFLIILLIVCSRASLVIGQVPVAPIVPSPAQSVLILVSGGYGVPARDRYVAELVDVLKKKGGIAVRDIHVEYLDLDRHSESDERARLAFLLKRKYAGADIKLVFCLLQPALNFLLKDIPEVAPQAPVLSWLAQLPPGTNVGNRRFVFQSSALDFGGTLQRALELFPRTERVIVIQGNSEEELARKETIRIQLEPWQGKLQIENTQALSADEIEVKLANAPKNTIIMGVGIVRDAKGQVFIPIEFIQRMLKTAKAPFFVLFDTNVGTGTVGGMVSRVIDEAASLSGLGLDVLHGTIRLSGPVSHITGASVPTFDWQQVERWGANPSILPVETVFINRPTSLWGQYKTEVTATLGIILTLGSLIVALLIFNRRLEQSRAIATEAEERFRVIVHRAPEAILVYDFDHRRIVDANPMAERLFGCSRETLLQRGLERFYSHYQDEGGVIDSIDDNGRRVIAGEELMFERAIHSDDGRDLTCEVRLTLLPYRDQRLIRASFIDITERKLSEETLRANETRFRAVTQTARDAIVTIDSAGAIADCNSAGEMLFGYTEAELSGQNLTLLMPPRFRKRHEESMQRRLADGGVPLGGKSVEMIGQRKDGSEFPLELSISQWATTQGHFFTGFMRDISERKKAVDALRGSEELFRSLVQAAPFGIVVNDPNGVVEYINSTFSEILGYTLEDIPNIAAWRERAYPNPDYRQLVMAEWQRAIVAKTDPGPVDRSFLVRHKDGRSRDIRFVAIPLSDRRTLVTVQDITERKQAHE